MTATWLVEQRRCTTGRRPPRCSNLFWKTVFKITEYSRAMDGNGADDIWGTTVRNKRVSISGFMGIFATEDRDGELKTIWESMVLREYRMGDCHEEVVRPT